MIRIRPAGDDDLAALKEMAALSSGGITTLPSDVQLLKEKITDSQLAFGRELSRPKAESYLFVMEDGRRCVGCAGIHSRIGEPEPVWALHLGHVHQRSDYLPIDKKVKLLTPSQIASGPSELCTLFLHPDYRHKKLGPLLSLSRLLFIGAFPDRFGKEVMALVRGYQADGLSPFWEYVMRPFFEMSFESADALRYRDGRFIPDLVPRHPLYASLLPPKVRSTIGKAHPNTEPALKLLKEENFRFTRYVDLFDAGPYFGAKVGEIRILKACERVRVARVADEALHSGSYLTSNDRLDFRACFAHLRFEERGALLDAETAAALEVKEGDPITVAYPEERDAK